MKASDRAQPTSIARSVTSRPAAASGRLAVVDLWRGAAIIGVVLYHIGWDLSFFGYAPADMMFSGPALLFARSLAGSFMFLCGVGLVLAHSTGIDGQRFLRRLLKIVGAALIISIVTYALFPSAFVYFGILHSIAVASLLGLAFLFIPIWTVVLAALTVLVAGNFVESSAFDGRITAWIGFAVNPPPSNDFVPVFPWFGLTLAGIAAARFIQSMPRPLPLNPQRFPRWLAWTGRHTLSIYLIHQPILFGVFFAIAWITG